MQNQPRRRRKPALSCVECRRRKIKCNRDSPCAHCISAKLTCTYHPYESKQAARPDQSSNRPALSRVPLAAPTSRAVHIGHSQHSASAGNQGLHDSAHVHGDQSNEADLVLTHVVRAKEADLVGLEEKIQNLEDKIASDEGHDQTSPNLFSVGPNLALKVSLKKSRVAGWSDRMGNDLFANILACYKEASGVDGSFSHDAETKSAVGEIGSLLRKSKRVSRSLKACRPTRNPMQPYLGVDDLPPRQQADAMASLYFESFESAHRILHAPSFWQQYRQYWALEEVAIDVRLTILLVIAIGSSLSEDYQVDSTLDKQAHQWVYASQSWLSGPLEKNQLSISGLQIYCLTILARQILAIGGDLIWISAGSLLHQAMQMGLHRDPTHLPNMSPLQAELRRRLWATILDFNIQSSLDSALPPRISIHDFDVKFPSNIDDCELNESSASVTTHPDDTFTETSTQRLLLRSVPVRLRALQMLNGLRDSIAYPEVLEFSRQIIETCQACSAFMKKHGAARFQCNMLDYLQRRILLPLHCLFANEARTQPIFYYSVKVSLDTAVAIVSFKSDEKFARLMTIAGGMFREGIRYASITIAMEILSQAQLRHLSGGDDHAINGTLFKKLMQDLIDQSVERIRKGETNIKNPMFLSMVMTQADAVEDGRPARLKMAEAARDSLEYCYGLLKQRQAAEPLTDSIETAETSASSFGDVDGFEFDLDFDFFMPDMAL